MSERYFKTVKKGPDGTRYLVWCANLLEWLKEIEAPFESNWPAPKCTRTEPPTEKDADSNGRILVWCDNHWRHMDFRNANGFQYWLRQPPAPEPEKSEEEKAWEDYPRRNAGIYVPDEKAAFLAGYQAAKKDQQ